MSQKQRGIGVKWGNSLTAMTGLMGVGTFKAQNQTTNKDSDKVEIKDGNKEVCGVVYYNGRKTLSIDVTPVGATLAAAKTNNSLSVDNGTLVTLVDADDADVNGTWILEKSAKMTSGEEAKLTFDLIQYADSNVQTAIS